MGGFVLEMADPPLLGHFIAIVVRGGLRNSATSVAQRCCFNETKMTHPEQASNE